MASNSSISDINYTVIDVQPFDSWLTYTPTIVIIVQSCFVVPSLILFWRRRHLFPIAGRDGGGYSYNYNPSLGKYGCDWTFGSGLAACWLMYGFMIVLLLWPETDSAIMRRAVLWSGLLTLAGFLTNRILLLLFNFEIQNQIKTATAERSTTSSPLQNNYIEEAGMANATETNEHEPFPPPAISPTNNSKLGFNFDFLSENKSKNLFIRFKNYITNRNLLILFCLFALVLIGAFWIPNILSDEEYSLLNYGPVSSGVGTAFIGVMIILMVFNAAIGVRLSRYWQDAWKIKQEMLYLASLLIGVEVDVFIFLREGRSIAAYVDYTSLPFIWAAFYVIIILPLQRTYKFQKRKNSIVTPIPNQTAIHQVQIDYRNFSNLQELLELEGGFDCFLRFTESEFSSENLLFYGDYQKFLEKYNQFKHPTPNTRGLTLAQLIERTYSMAMRYLAPGSAMEINIPAEIREEAVNKLEIIKSKETALTAENFESQLGFPLGAVYSDAFHNVLNLMQSDTFVRFLYSPICKTFRYTAST